MHPATVFAETASDDVVGLIRTIIRHELAARPSSAIGFVESVQINDGSDPAANNSCDVRLSGRELVLARVPVAVDHIGSVPALRVGEAVLVLFVGGDVQRPVVAGRLYTDQRRVPEHKDGACLVQVPPGAAEDQRLDLLLDPQGDDGRTATLTLAPDVTCTVTGKKVDLKAGELAVTLDLDAGSVVVTTGKATLTLKDDGAVTLACDGDLGIEAQGALKLKGMTVAVEASAETAIKGQPVNIN